MKIPDIPYDNLYKFIAIAGLFLIFLSSTFLLYGNLYLKEKYADTIVDYLEIESELEQINEDFNVTYGESQEKTGDILDRMKEIYEERSEISKNLSEKISKWEPALESADSEFQEAMKIIEKSECFLIKDVADDGAITLEKNQSCVDKQPNKIELEKAWQNTVVASGINRIFNEKIMPLLRHDFESIEELDNEFENLSQEANQSLSKRDQIVNEFHQKIEKIIDEDQYLEKYYKYKIFKDKSDFLKYMGIFLWPILVIGMIMTFGGFALWYNKTQKIIDKSLKIDLEIKRIELEKLKKNKKKD